MLSSSHRRFLPLGFLSLQQFFANSVGFVRPLHSSPHPLKCAATNMVPRGAAATTLDTTAPTNKDMMCFQCEQTKHGKSCSPAEGSTQGVCGKTPETAALQDLLIHYTFGVSQYAHAARVHSGLSDVAVDRFILESLFR
jgi:hypothetical protein